MYYFEVLVASQRYHGSEALTYSSTNKLEIGSLVTVNLGNASTLGIVSNNVTKPAFTTKPIKEVHSNLIVPGPLLNLHTWISAYYPGPHGLITQLFTPTNMSGKPPAHVQPGAIPASLTPQLRAEQQDAVAKINKSKGAFLLHGQTGSGKTRVYQELVLKTLLQGRSAVILTPEIGLVPQLSQRMTEQFPGRVVTLHSGLKATERRSAWIRVATSIEPLIIVGPRSALFAPVKDIGLIVMDEAHDSAYKQEQAPRYVTSRVAGKLASLHNANLILGSATPLIEDYYTFTAKRLPIITLNTPPDEKHGPSKITVVDIKDRAHFSRSAWLSDELLNDINESLKRSLQSLVFLNRRGTARIVICQTCGWQATCQRCDLPLTYHGDQHLMRCHTCGYSEAAKTSCPTCSSSDIKYKSVGTKTITDELAKLFPGANIQRFDSDNSKAERIDENFDNVLAGNVDIIVGTQLISKGLDLPKLRSVGIVSSDTSLSFPDYTAEEKTYQMLVQVMGRVGRGHQEGSIVIQTYQPDSIVINSALAGNYGAFYDSQTKERETFHFPPFYFTLKISVQRKLKQNAQQIAYTIAENITKLSTRIELIGPTPAFSEKLNGLYIWQITVKAKDRSELLKVVSGLPANTNYDLDPNNLL